MVSFIHGITKTTGLIKLGGMGGFDCFVLFGFFYSFGIFFSGFITMKNIYQYRF